MKVIIAGSRSITNRRDVEYAVKKSGFNIGEVVCGMARGVDTSGAIWARRNGIPVKPFYAAFKTPDGGVNYSAGKERNERMAQYADALIAVWDGESSGTEDMIIRMRNACKPIFIYVTEEL